MSTEGKLTRRGSLVLFVTGPGQGSAEEQQGAATIVDTLVQAVDAATDGVVLAGPVASARAGGQVKAVRDDVTAAREVSTVDSLGRTAGQVVTVMALAGQAGGRDRAVRRRSTPPTARCPGAPTARGPTSILGAAFGRPGPVVGRLEPRGRSFTFLLIRPPRAEPTSGTDHGSSLGRVAADQARLRHRRRRLLARQGPHRLQPRAAC